MIFTFTYYFFPDYSLTSLEVNYYYMPTSIAHIEAHFF